MLLRMSFHHVVMYRWKPDADVDIEALAKGLRSCAEALPGCEVFRAGPDLQLKEDNYDFALSGTWTDRAAWDRYVADAEHMRLAKEVIWPGMAGRASVQFES
jgi:quinol monooxygenase YgiN